MSIINEIYFKRDPKGIKSDYGKVLIIAGSKKYPGAAFIASKFAELSGVGYVGLSVPNAIYDASVIKTSANVVHELLACDDDFLWNENYAEIIKGYNSILFGNGVNLSASNLSFLASLLNTASSLVIDGTGLGLVAKNVLILNRKITNKVLLTPHIGELKKLLCVDIDSRNPIDYLDKTISFCKNYKVNVLIKSYISILVLEDGTYIESEYRPTPSLSRAGSGDALAGYIAGLLAYVPAKYPYHEVITEADKIIHQAAYQFEFANNQATINSDKLAAALEGVIKNLYKDN